MVTKTPMSIPRRQRNKLQTRERIIDAAIQIFAEQGIEAATVDAIAGAADVGKGTIYNYFRTKEDIVVAFLVDVERRVQHEVGGIVFRGRTLESILIASIEMQFKMKAPYHAFVRVFLAQMFGRTAAFLPWMQQLQAVIDPPLDELFTRLQERGLVRHDIRISQLVQVFKVMHLGMTSLWAIEGPPWTGTTSLVRLQIRLFCHGLSPQKS